MLVTPLPIVTLVKPLQYSKAEEPMLVTLSGIINSLSIFFPSIYSVVELDIKLPSPLIPHHPATSPV